jgi:hypothetical protein
VAKEDPVPACRVGVAGQVRRGGRGYFHARHRSAYRAVRRCPSTAAPGRPIDSRSTSDDPRCAVPAATDP